MKTKHADARGKNKPDRKTATGLILQKKTQSHLLPSAKQPAQQVFPHHAHDVVEGAAVAVFI